MADIIFNDVDSKIINQNIIELSNYNIDDDFFEIEKEYLNKYKPLYVLSRVDSKNIEVVNNLLCNGFAYIEFQMKYIHETSDYSEYLSAKKVSFEKVTEEFDLDNIKRIAGTTFNIDRIYIDKEFRELFKYDVAQLRYESYVKNSYLDENQCVYKVTHSDKGTIGFFTMYFPNDKNKHALLFLIGLDSSFKGMGYGADAIKAYISVAYKKGYKNVISSLSGINIPMINSEFVKCGAKLYESSIILRKLYKRNIII